MPPALLITSLVHSIQVGSLYALMALGITLTMRVIRLPNFAHAEFVSAGAFAALVVSIFLSRSPVVILACATLSGAAVALLSHLLVFRPMSRRKLSTYAMLLVSFAVGLILRYILFVLSDSYQLFDKRIQIPMQILVRESFIVLTNFTLTIVPVSIACVMALALLLARTALGREMRALASNPELAHILGMRVERIRSLTWLLTGATAGLAGALWGLYTFVNPLLGWLAILPVFAAAILGGLSSFTGTILGAYLVAFCENTLMQALNHYTGLTFSFKAAIPFVIIILVLLLRPQGLTGFLRQNRNIER
ncbi:MAG: branched-chain amino acid ABC transporter permease [Anaerolineae bacterium]|nr:branched-chain amino acid ABC transporter permease [Anaerolineae bacterium]